MYTNIWSGNNVLRINRATKVRWTNQIIKINVHFVMKLRGIIRLWY